MNNYTIIKRRPIILKTHKLVNKDVTDFVVKCLSKLFLIMPIQHRINIYIRPVCELPFDNCNVGGLFWAPEIPIKERKSFREPLKIELCGIPMPDDSEISFKYWTFWLLVHEILHYCQFRDGRKLTERGITVRTRNILKITSRIRFAA